MRKLLALFRKVNDSPLTGPAPLWWTVFITTISAYAVSRGWGNLCQ